MPSDYLKEVRARELAGALGPDDRTLEQRLLEYLFPKQGPQDQALQSHGVPASDRALLQRIPADLQQQLVRICDAVPVIARDLARLVVDVSSDSYDSGFDKGHDEGYDEGDRDGRKNERHAIKQRLEAMQERVRVAMEEFKP